MVPCHDYHTVPLAKLVAYTYSYTYSTLLYHIYMLLAKPPSPNGSFLKPLTLTTQETLQDGGLEVLQYELSLECTERDKEAAMLVQMSWSQLKQSDGLMELYTDLLRIHEATAPWLERWEPPVMFSLGCTQGSLITITNLKADTRKQGSKAGKQLGANSAIQFCHARCRLTCPQGDFVYSSRTGRQQLLGSASL